MNSTSEVYDDQPNPTAQKITIAVTALIVLAIAFFIWNSYRVRQAQINALIAARVNPQGGIPTASEMIARAPMTEQLQGQPVAARRGAIEALAAMAANPGTSQDQREKADKELIPFMKDQLEVMRKLAQQRLIDLGPAISQAPVVGALGDGDGNVRAGAEAILIEFGKRPGSTVVADIAPKLADDGARGATGNVLAELGKLSYQKKASVPNAVPLTMAYLSPPRYAPLEAKVVEAINEDEWLGAISVLDRAGDPQAVPVLIPWLKVETTRRSAAGALGRMKDPRATLPLIEVLNQGLTRSEVAVALGTIRDPRAVEPLAGLLSTYSREVRRDAADALANIGAPSVPVLLRASRSADPVERAAASRALGRLTAGPARTAALAALKDPEAEVRMEAAEALGYSGDPAVAPALIALFNDRDGRVAQTASIALQQVASKPGGAPVISRLAALLSSTDQAQVFFASRALRNTGAPAVPALVAALREPRAAQSAALLLGEIGDAGARAALQQLSTTTTDENVRWAVRRSLARLGGSQSGEAPASPSEAGTA